MPRRARAAAPAESEERVAFPVIQMPAAATDAAKSVTEEREEVELEELLDQLGNDGKIVVYHILDGKATYAGVMTLEGFSQEALLDSYGGGDKSLVVFQGGRKVRTVRLFLDPSIPATSPRAKTMARNAPPGAVAQPVDQFAGIFARMLEMNANTTNMMQQAMAGIMAGVGTMMTRDQPRSDPLEVATRLAEVMTRNNNPGGGGTAAELFGAFEKGLGLAGKLAGEGDDPTLGIVGKGLDVVAKMVERGGLTLPAPNAPRMLPANPPRGPFNEPRAAAAPPPPPPPAPEPMNDRPWIAAIRPAAPLLLSMVGTFQPATAAQAVADRLKDEEFSDLLDDIESGPGVDDFLNRFLAAFGVGGVAAITPEQATWLRALVAAVKDLVDEDNDDLGEHDGDSIPE